MILTGHEDLRVVKTVEGIKKAFKELICEKDYGKITVKELSDRARINKRLFMPIMKHWMLCLRKCRWSCPPAFSNG